MQNVDTENGLSNGTRLRYLARGVKKNTLTFVTAKQKGKIFQPKRSSFKKKKCGGLRLRHKWKIFNINNIDDKIAISVMKNKNGNLELWRNLLE
jgi:hypothetical protein